MNLSNLKPALGSTHKTKRIGRGQGSGNGKTAGKGHKGAKARSGYKIKVGFEGGQQPLQRRLPKVGFTSRVKKPMIINVNKADFLFDLDELTFEKIEKIRKVPNDCIGIKLIGEKAYTLASKIKDPKITYSNPSKK